MTVDYRNQLYYNTTNLVVTQPVLKPSFAFYVQYTYYKKYFSESDHGCGPVRYTIDCNPPSTMMASTAPGDLSDVKGMKFSVFSRSNSYVGNEWLNITASVSPNYPKI